MNNIFTQLEQSGLTGRGGAGFPTFKKWQLFDEALKSAGAGVADAGAGAEGARGYIICNAAEGEPEVSKDFFILDNYPEVVIGGIKLALKTFPGTQAIIYINPDYFEHFEKKLAGLIKNLPIALFKKPHGYIAGEETTLLEAIEGNYLMPRQRPPYPIESGLWGYPTLINNVETLWAAEKISRGEYKNTRFYTIGGEVTRPGNYELSEMLTIKQVLEQTGNFPDFEFFVQGGGGASGEIFLDSELDQVLKGAGSLVIFNRATTDPWKLMLKWVEFYGGGNCGKCVPCREGFYRLREMLKTPVSADNQSAAVELVKKLALNLRQTSFCPLGRSGYGPLMSLLEKIILK